jgi:PEGA domain/WD40-like Beta Propeller Repeat
MLGTSRSSTEVTVELPFIVVFEPPSKAELQAMLHLRRAWLCGSVLALAVGTLLAAALTARGDALADGPGAPLRIVSHPAGASVWIDDAAVGSAPLELTVPRGSHAVTLRAPDALDSPLALSVDTNGTNVELGMWRRRPAVLRLKPSMPGAHLADARLLPTGDVTLSVSVPPGQLETWRLDPGRGALNPVLERAAAVRAAISPDGERVAYLGYPIGPPSALSSEPPTTVWLSAPFARTPTALWQTPTAERLSDVSWSPREDRLLIVTQRLLGDGTSLAASVWTISSDAPQAADAHATRLLSLPSQPVPGSLSWSPDGQWVAFLAHADGLNALCLLGLDGTFRYLADLEPTSDAPLPYVPAEWSADSQQLVYVAPRQPAPDAALAWFESSQPSALFVARVADAAPPTLLHSFALQAPTWYADGRVLGLKRANDSGGLEIRLAKTIDTSDQVVSLPIKADSSYAAAWSTDHARLLIATPKDSNATPEYWLVMLGLEAKQ